MKTKFEYLALIIVYSVIGIIFTWPLVRNFNSQIPNNLHSQGVHTYEWGDQLNVLAGYREHYNYLSNILGRRPLYDKELCLEEIEKCKLSNLQILKSVVFSPYWLHTGIFTLTQSDEISYNLSVLLSFVMTGIFAYIFAVELGSDSQDKNLNKLVAFASSLFITILPYRIHQLLVGHRIGWLVGLMFLLMFALERNLRCDAKSKLKYQILIALLMIFFSFTEHFLVLFSLIYIAARVAWFELIENFVDLREFWKNFKQILLRNIWIIFVFALSFGINLATKLQDIAKSNVSAGRSLEVIGNYSPAFGQIFAAEIFDHEQNIYLGIGSFVVFVAFAVLIYEKLNLRKYFKLESNLNLKSIKLIFYLFLFIFALTLAFGTHTPVYEIFYKYVPFFKFSRTPGKFIILAAAALVAINQISLNYIISKLKKINFKIALLSIFALLTILSLHTSWAVSLSVLPKQIQSLSNDEKVLFLPFAVSDNFFNSTYEYNISKANAVMINGYTPFTNQSYLEFENKYRISLNLGNLNDEEFKDFIKIYQIDRIVIYDPEARLYINEMEKTEYLPKSIIEMIESSNIFEMKEEDGMVVYERIPPSRTAYSAVVLRRLDDAGSLEITT